MMNMSWPEILIAVFALILGIGLITTVVWLFVRLLGRLAGKSDTGGK